VFLEVIRRIESSQIVIKMHRPIWLMNKEKLHTFSERLRQYSKFTSNWTTNNYHDTTSIEHSGRNKNSLIRRRIESPQIVIKMHRPLRLMNKEKLHTFNERLRQYSKFTSNWTTNNYHDTTSIEHSGRDKNFLIRRRIESPQIVIKMHRPLRLMNKEKLHTFSERLRQYSKFTSNWTTNNYHDTTSIENSGRDKNSQIRRECKHDRHYFF